MYIEEEYDADTCSTGPATRLLAASSNALRRPAHTFELVVPTKYATHHSSLSAARLIAMPTATGVKQSQYAYRKTVLISTASPPPPSAATSDCSRGLCSRGPWFC
jgi:hypothetical protein